MSGKPRSENDNVRMVLQQHECRLAVRCFDHLVALRGQPHPKQLADGRFIVNNEDLERCGGHAAVSKRRGSSGIGRQIVNTAPLRSGRLAATIVPCMASTKPREIARPRPARPHMVAFLNTVEFVEDILQVVRRYAVPLIRYVHTSSITVNEAPNADGGTSRGIFRGIVEDIEQHLLEQNSVDRKHR